MSVRHLKRIEGVVDETLKAAALGEPYGFVVSPPSIWPQMDNKGTQVGVGPAWFVLVSIRAGLDKTDIMHGFPVHGMMPADDIFRQVAKTLIENARKERDEKANTVLAEAQAKFRQQMEAK